MEFKTLKHNLKKDTSEFSCFKFALLGDSATQFLAIALKGWAIEKGFSADVFEAEYNQVERQIMDGNSELYSFDADYIIIFQSTHKLLSHYNKLSLNKQNTIADERLDFVKHIISVFSKKRQRIIYFNYPEIDDAVFGSFSNKIEFSFLYQVRKINYELMKIAQSNANFFICDIAAIQNKIGRDVMFSPSVYTSTEMVLSLDAIPIVASRAIDIVCAAQGASKKCVILDLDNTLWGGVIGDDGIENIQLGHGLGIGKAFTEFQYWLKKLKLRGIILAVCSKNNENTAKEAFIKHPDMVLKLDDISVFVANWENKADNIRHIQSILNIGFDSMVFIDDNPAERDIVRKNILGITVPELPQDPAEYLEYLYSLNLFESVAYSNADAERTMQYQVEAERALTRQTFTNEGEFLKSLDMICEICCFDKFNTPRVAQLSQRSNQFNLRTVRYTDADIAHIAADNSFKNFTFSLKDKFGDNGLVCVVILKKEDAKTLFVETWFMSCRVLKRGMEHFVLNTITTFAKENNFKEIIGEYIATSKNDMVKSHYLGLGFEPQKNDEDRNLFVLNVEKYQEKECFIKSVYKENITKI
ncbi:MAG: HAD-IIIC family phosphatase [Spirochaetaceae bacterium]|jgi:FkbH-like protein|nr:HAD-IIIC family phosphatase [Spirochaetaceae bacterium]